MSNNNGLSSLEYTMLSFNNFNINNDVLPLTYFNKLVNDFSNLLNNSDYYDVEIKVGVEDVKIFRAHSTILKARSLYFRAALSSNWIRESDNGNILFEKENISPRVFEILLIYMYNGIISINNLDSNEILDLLEACDELNFNELIDDLQNYLINEKKEWLHQNLIYVYDVLSKHQLFSILQDFCNKLISKNPGSILQSNDIATIEKSMLASILENDNLKLDEIDIWNYVIQWGIGQNKALENDNISEWNKDEFRELKIILSDIIPLIRFSEISGENFYEKVNPYKKIFDKNIYKELLQYYITNKWQPKFILQRGPRTRIEKGRLLNSNLKTLISDWINQNNDINISYDFELIICGSQDGFSKAIFEEKCFNIKQTVTLMKIKETGELVGGYNPVCWNIIGKSSSEKYSIKTDQSFIFKIDENQPDNSILSRINKPEFAIYHYDQINYTFDNIKIHEASIAFYDLRLYNSINNEPYCYYYYYDVYGNSLELINYKRVQLLKECEVYKLVRKN